VKGKTSLPASAPNMTALMTLLERSVAASISKPMKRLERWLAASRMRSLLPRPSPMAVFSDMA
jgi:hypothetical protein